MAETPIEKIKKKSDGLRGALKKSLQDEHTGQIRGDQVLIKFHGMYMQDDRDRRDNVRKKVYSYDPFALPVWFHPSAQQWITLK